MEETKKETKCECFLSHPKKNGHGIHTLATPTRAKCTRRSTPSSLLDKITSSTFLCKRLRFSRVLRLSARMLCLRINDPRSRASGSAAGPLPCLLFR